MSIATEITRLQNAKASIKTSIENKGVTVPSATKLDGYPALIDSIPTGSQVTVEPLSVTQNGTYQETGKAYSPVTVNVQGGGGVNNGNDVIFIDYDGTVVASYSKDNLEMPANPSHTGLTAQGWNWTQAEIEAQLTAYPDQPVYVGQMYVTDDGDTRIYVHFEEGRTSPYLGLGVNGTVTVDWGDGSETSTLTGTSLTSSKTIHHIYQPGDYIIKITPTSGSFSIFGVSNTSHILKVSTATTANISKVYTNAVRKVELGANATIGAYAFNNCYSLATITVPSSVTSIGNYAFNYCYSLVSITIPTSVKTFGNYTFQNCSSIASIAFPNGVTSIGQYLCRACSSLKRITISDGIANIPQYTLGSCYSLASFVIPNGVTSISPYAFFQCNSIATITVPSSVTSIGNYAFQYCYGISEYHFKSITPPTLATTTAFDGVTSDCVFYVPSESLEDYKAATNWSTYASYMVGE